MAELYSPSTRGITRSNTELSSSTTDTETSLTTPSTIFSDTQSRCSFLREDHDSPLQNPVSNVARIFENLREEARTGSAFSRNHAKQVLEELIWVLSWHQDCRTATAKGTHFHVWEKPHRVSFPKQLRAKLLTHYADAHDPGAIAAIVMSTSAAEGSKGRYATPRASMLGDIFNPARDPDRQGFWIFIVHRSSVRVGMWRKASGELLLHTRMTSEGITAKELRLDNLEDIDLLERIFDMIVSGDLHPSVQKVQRLLGNSRWHLVERDKLTASAGKLSKRAWLLPIEAPGWDVVAKEEVDAHTHWDWEDLLEKRPWTDERDLRDLRRNVCQACF